MEVISFRVPAVPVAQPRARATAFGGHARVYEAKAGHAIHSFKATCRMACEAAFKGPALTGPLAVTMVCLFPRPTNKVWKSKPMTREWKPNKPDADNLAKSLFDALNGILWVDDSQIVFASVKKLICAGDEQPGVMVTVEPA